MDIDNGLVENIARLARLKLTDSEINKFIPQLKEILGTFSELDKVDTKNTKSSFQPVEIKDILREDEEGGCLTQEQALKNTEHKKDGYFKGPRAV